MQNRTVPAAAEGLPPGIADQLASLAYDARMAARIADYLAADLLAEQRPGADGPRVNMPAEHADMLMHAMHRARLSIEAAERAIEGVVFPSSGRAAR